MMKSKVVSYVTSLPVICGWLLIIGLTGAAAGGGVERVTLMLDGETCAESRAAIEAALRAMTGVKAVDLGTVPGHALVDIDAGTLAPDQVAAAVNRHATGRCTAEVMKSCISTTAMK